jgi:hypothetical protein
MAVEPPLDQMGEAFPAIQRGLASIKRRYLTNAASKSSTQSGQTVDVDEAVPPLPPDDPALIASLPPATKANANSRPILPASAHLRSRVRRLDRQASQASHPHTLTRALATAPLPAACILSRTNQNSADPYPRGWPIRPGLASRVRNDRRRTEDTTHVRVSRGGSHTNQSARHNE